ncbi:hypothetical protein ACFSL4_01775 [Streptomyces caeni]|uniref:DUF3168 domain-containing protein n=1 Tax=Streptomyces caeni TaxID=2307231 RepID=A0ABW4ILH2_9ACTN
MIAWESTVPAAIDGLVAAFTTAEGLAGVVVLDGPEVREPSAMEVVSVGYPGADDEFAVDGSVSADGMASSPDLERYSVQCAAAVLDGSGNVRAARQRVYALVAACGEAIARDRTLGGAVLQATIGSTSLRQTQDSRGVTATVVFSVDCDAFTSP